MSLLASFNGNHTASSRELYASRSSIGGEAIDQGLPSSVKMQGVRAFANEFQGGACIKQLRSMSIGSQTCSCLDKLSDHGMDNILIEPLLQTHPHERFRTKRC